MIKNLLFLILCFALLISTNCFCNEKQTEVIVNQCSQEEQSKEEKQQIQLLEQKKQVIDSQVKGMHLTILATASQFYKTRINDLLDNTEMNAVVIDIKEIDGRISIKDVAGNIDK